MVALTTWRNVSQYPFGKELSPATSRRQPPAPAASQRFAIALGPVRKYCQTAVFDSALLMTGIESNPNQPSYVADVEPPEPAQVPFPCPTSWKKNQPRNGEVVDSHAPTAP